MQVQQHTSLKPFNTFSIDVTAKYFAAISTIDELQECLLWAKNNDNKSLILGGGSNILFTKNYDGIVINNLIKGIEKVGEDETYIYIKAGAGEGWHQFVLYCLHHNYAGVENLALIPGFVGASPMQNIGAYGVEIKEVFHELTALHKSDLALHTFSNTNCKFGYRESIFKNEYKDQFVIISVTYRLRKTPVFNIEYGAIKQQLEKNNIEQLSIQAVANAVIAIRTSKLPDPKQIGNAGSFFKNPSVSKEKYEGLKNKFPGLVAYENNDGTMKLAAGWLIEQCGLKGYRNGNAGVHNQQALVLVNYGGASGKDLLQLCGQVQEAVLQKFGVALHAEVNIV